jgi:GDPmannose 4,6-dehydratase
MWLMLQQDTPDDYVIATNKTWSIKEFLDEAFKVIGINDWEPYIKIDPKFIRPAEVDILRGDCTKARTQLNWNPRTSFSDMVKTMVDNDIKLLSK